MTPDDDLRSRFDALRRIDESAVPDLDALVARPRTRNGRPLVRVALLAAAAVIIAVVGLRVFKQPPHPVPLDAATSIVTWQSPTASLLHTPGQELLRTVPTLRSSLLRGVPMESLVTRTPGA